MPAPTKRSLLSASLAALLLAGCGSKSGNPPAAARSQAPAAATANANATIPGVAVSPAEDQAGRLAFPKTLAAGRQSWVAANVRVKFLRQAEGVKREGWTARCAAPAPVGLNGNYPNVFLSLPTFDCGDRAPHELAELGAITHALHYRAVPVPAASDPDQFRLYLAGADTGDALRLSAQKSLNAMAKDRLVYLDFDAEEQRDLAYPENRHHFVQVTIEPGEDAGTAKLTAEYIYDAEANAEHEELKVTAELGR